MGVDLKHIRELFLQRNNDEKSMFVRVSTDTYDICFNHANVFADDKKLTIISSDNNQNEQITLYTIYGNTIQP